MGPGDMSGSGDMTGSGDMSGSGGESPVDMGPGSGSGMGSEDPVDMGSGSGGEDPVNMGSGSGSGSESSSGARCAPKVLMDKCAVDCNGGEVNPLNLQVEFMSANGETTWKILADNPANKITLTGCAGFTGPQVTECKDGEWTMPKEVSEIC